MLVFPNSKLNLGLNVIKKRDDGFHDLETIFYPINWCDALEVIESKSAQPFELTFSGIKVEGDFKENIIYKTFKLLQAYKKMPDIKVHLHKNIPMGAGLGGGSSNASFFINLLDNHFSLNLTQLQKHEIATQLGSDCPFFLQNKPVYAFAKGTEFSAINVNLASYYILVVYPGIHSNTREAFSGLLPQASKHDLKNTIENIPVSEWKNVLFNDFEKTIFIKYPEIKNLKEQLYSEGALYASLSGSGSSVYAIFTAKPEIKLNPAYQWYLQGPSS